jgi:hypothetical protein
MSLPSSASNNQAFYFLHPGLFLDFFFHSEVEGHIFFKKSRLTFNGLNSVIPQEINSLLIFPRYAFRA